MGLRKAWQMSVLMRRPARTAHGSPGENAHRATPSAANVVVNTGVSAALAVASVRKPASAQSAAGVVSVAAAQNAMASAAMNAVLSVRMGAVKAGQTCRWPKPGLKDTPKRTQNGVMTVGVKFARKAAIRHVMTVAMRVELKGVLNAVLIATHVRTRTLHQAHHT